MRFQGDPVAVANRIALQHTRLEASGPPVPSANGSTPAFTPVCDCHRLANILIRKGKSSPLSEHACPNLVVGCSVWAVSSLSTLPDVYKLSVTEDERRWFIPFGFGRFAEVDNAWRWPISTNYHSDLYAVIRESVEEKSQPKGISLVEDKPEWKAALEQLRGESEATRDSWDGGPIPWYGERPDLWIPKTLAVLADLHLPTTLSTARFALWSISDARSAVPPAWPTRGVLITSFCLGPAAGSRHRLVPSSWNPVDVVFQIHGSQRWLTKELWSLVSSVTEDHRDWWGRMSDEALLAIPNLRVSNPGRPADDDWQQDIRDLVDGRIDREEAIRREVGRLRKEAGNGSGLYLSELRRRASKRVDIRHKRALDK